jgi:hypothetical protein
MSSNWKKMYWTIRRTKDEAILREFAELFGVPKVPTFIEEDEYEIPFDDPHKFQPTEEQVRLERKQKFESLLEEGTKRKFITGMNDSDIV